MRKVHYKSGNSLSIAIFFLGLLTLLIAGGILLKLFLVWRVSSFDGSHQYVLQVLDKVSQKGEFIIFSPDIHHVSIVQLSGKTDSYARYFSVPVDASIARAPSENISDILTHLLFSQKTSNSPTSLDALRLLLFTGSLSQRDFTTQSIALSANTKDAENILASVFLDNALYNDNETVAVVNATGIAGVGNTIAHSLGILGMDVISVTTGDSDATQSSLVAANVHTYSVSRIQHIFHISPSPAQGPMVSDITLTIGKDLLSQVQ